MKSNKFNILLVALFSLSIFFIACKEQHNHLDEAEVEILDESGPEYTSAYVCPMHCEGSGSHDPGVCPACGMDYVHNPDADHSGHNH